MPNPSPGIYTKYLPVLSLAGLISHDYNHIQLYFMVDWYYLFFITCQWTSWSVCQLGVFYWVHGLIEMICLVVSFLVLLIYFLIILFMHGFLYFQVSCETWCLQLCIFRIGMVIWDWNFSTKTITWPNILQPKDNMTQNLNPNKWYGWVFILKVTNIFQRKWANKFTSMYVREVLLRYHTVLVKLKWKLMFIFQNKLQTMFWYPPNKMQVQYPIGWGRYHPQK